MTDREQYLATVLDEGQQLNFSMLRHTGAESEHAPWAERALMSIIDTLITRGCEAEAVLNRAETQWRRAIDTERRREHEHHVAQEAAESRLAAVREWRRVNSRILDERMILHDLDRIFGDTPTTKEERMQEGALPIVACTQVHDHLAEGRLAAARAVRDLMDHDRLADRHGTPDSCWRCLLSKALDDTPTKTGGTET